MAMEEILNKFLTESLFEASGAMLSALNIKYFSQTSEPMPFADLYADALYTPMPKALQAVVDKVENTYFVGMLDEESLHSIADSKNIDIKTVDSRWEAMLVFAVDIKEQYRNSLTRSEIATLSRGFNRLSNSVPVILFVRNGSFLSLATCERSDYSQEWRIGEKLGKVSILRDINCERPHRGHLDILASLGEKSFTSFDEWYRYWLDVFSSEVLTRKFYAELAKWYAWAIESGEVKFPNDITTTDDDTKYNHEAVIRLITRLIFVWFLRKKHLVPNEFFNENYIRVNFIENFDPHSTNTLFYNPGESKYYRLILQNLFFAMLNRPIVDEESGADENRRFATGKRYRGVSPDYNINNLLRYQSEFRTGGAEKLLHIANTTIPFLNGGLFECLDEKDKGLYYDGFSENRASLQQLSFPDYFFFGEEGEFTADLSSWFDDKSMSNSKVRGIINILQSYNFTVEENTPLDQEVSLDPELLGKAFENLLASYNPETKTSARKQTGSFYTPRPIVQYMVDESLVAHLKRKCPNISEDTFRNLFNYSADNFDATQEERHHIMQALYECKGLDPACGSGAFPMGMLQQMVHALRKLDPSNEMWRDFILELALAQDKEAYQVEDEEERSRIRKDIEQSFNRSVNDPDYARKLYIIENCIYGVDIQPIAVQISKLRFFISLVAEQKPTSDPATNFGIRPLPNLEAKFVAANTLIQLSKDESLFSSDEFITNAKSALASANHKNFLAKRNRDKKKIQHQIADIRLSLANHLAEIGVLTNEASKKIADWNMFEQNKSSDFFDFEWMFGLKNGFDIIIGNPPYIRRTNLLSSDKAVYEKQYQSAKGQYDIYLLFIEFALNNLKERGILCFINPLRFFNADYGDAARNYICNNSSILQIIDVSQLKVFQSAMTYPCIFLLQKEKRASEILFVRPNSIDDIQCINPSDKLYFSQLSLNQDKRKRFLIGDDKLQDVVRRIENKSYPFAFYFDCARGLANKLVDFNDSVYEAYKSKQVKRYHIEGQNLLVNTKHYGIFENEMIIMPRTVAFLQATLKPKKIICLDRIYYLMPNGNVSSILPFLGVFNSKLINFWFEFNYWSTKVSGNYFDLNGNQILSVPFPKDLKDNQTLISLVQDAIDKNGEGGTGEAIDKFLYNYFEISEDEIKLMSDFMLFNGHTL